MLANPNRWGATMSERETCICDRVWCHGCGLVGSFCRCSESKFIHKESEGQVHEPNLGEDEANWLRDSDEVCGTCNARLADEDQVPCDGEPCASCRQRGDMSIPALFHETCLTRVANQHYTDGALLCSPCVAAGVMPYAQSASDDSEEEL